MGKLGITVSSPAAEPATHYKSSAGTLGEHPKPASLNEVITDSGGESATSTEAKPDSPPGRRPSSSACIPYQDVIEVGLSRGRNAMAIWQELVDTCGFASGYQSVRRFVSRLQGGQSSEPRRDEVRRVRKALFQ